MNVDELYKYVAKRTGLRKFHLGLGSNTEFTEEEAEELALCIIKITEQSEK